MKKLLLLFFIGCFAAVSGTQAQQMPQGMKYQAVARNLMGGVLANQPVTLKITLTSKTTNSAKAYYSETHTVTTNALGLFDLTVGAGKAGAGSFKSIPWSAEDIWMEIAIQDNGKNAFSTISSSRLLAVPYAFHAMTANELVGSPASAARVAAGGPTDGVPSNVWSTFGNTKTDPSTDRMGTMDYVDLIFVTNKIERLRITKDGDINITNSLNVGKDVVIGNDLTVKQDVYLNTTGGVTIVNGPLTVANGKPTILTGTLNVNGATDLDNTLNVDGIATISNPTQSTSKTNGALVVVGGAGIGKNINVGGNGDVDGTLNVDGVTTISNPTESTSKTNGALIVVGGVGIGKNVNVGGNGDVDGTLNVDGATTLNNTLTVIGNTTINGLTNITNTTQSTLPTNGAFIVAGGVGIGKNLNVGGNERVNGTFNVNSSTDLDGSLNVDGVTTHNAQVTINANLNGADSNDGVYPLRVKGSNQGIVIEVTGSRNNDNNFVTFRDASGIWGRIEGQTTSELESTSEYKTQVALFVLEGVALAADIVGLGVEAAEFYALLITIPAAVGITAQITAAAIHAASLLTESITWSERVHNNVGVSYESGAGDYAEWLERGKTETNMIFGQIVGVRGGKLSLCTDGADHYMAISKKPIVLGNMPGADREKDFEKVAFMGQVPVRVVGKVAIGDYIIPSGNHDGMGIAVSPAEMKLGDYARIVGVAWQAAKDAPLNIVNVAVGINTNDLTSKMVAMNQKLDLMNQKTDNIMAFLQGKAPLQTGDAVPAVTAEKAGKGVMSAQTNMGKTMSDADFDRAIDKTSPQLIQYFGEAKAQLVAKGIDVNANPYLSEFFSSPIASVKQLRRDPSMSTQWGRFDQQLQNNTKK